MMLLQYFQERHFDGVFPTLLKYKFTQADIDRGKIQGGPNSPVGIASTSEFHQLLMVLQYNLILKRIVTILKFLMMLLV